MNYVASLLRHSNPYTYDHLQLYPDRELNKPSTQKKPLTVVIPQEQTHAHSTRPKEMAPLETTIKSLPEYVKLTSLISTDTLYSDIVTKDQGQLVLREDIDVALHALQKSIETTLNRPNAAHIYPAPGDSPSGNDWVNKDVFGHSSPEGYEYDRIVLVSHFTGHFSEDMDPANLPASSSPKNKACYKGLSIVLFLPKNERCIAITPAHTHYCHQAVSTTSPSLHEYGTEIAISNKGIIVKKTDEQVGGRTVADNLPSHIVIWSHKKQSSSEIRQLLNHVNDHHKKEKLPQLIFEARTAQAGVDYPGFPITPVTPQASGLTQHVLSTLLPVSLSDMIFGKNETTKIA